MALSWFLPRRGSAAARWAASSYRSAASSSSSFSARLAPFSSFTSVPQLNGLPFDSVDLDRKMRTMTLTRKTEDEIIKILVKEKYCNGKETTMRVKIHYGLDFKKCMKFDIEALPDNPGQFVIPRVKISVEGKGEDDDDHVFGFITSRGLKRSVEGEGEEVHVDEFEGFLERRGLNRTNVDFMIQYAMQCNERANRKIHSSHESD